MKSIKVFYHGKRLKDVYPYATRLEVMKFRAGRFMRKTLIVSAIITTSGWLIYGGIAYEKFTAKPLPVEAQIVKVPVETSAPVLDRIAKCESGDTHYKNGQVIVKSNSNGSVDIGRYQVNSVWNVQATKLGYDLTKETDNKTFAKWLYANYGTEPWYSSKKCWSK